jgi:hypothetical protein
VGTTVERLLPPDDDGVGTVLLELTREIAAKELAPKVHEAEERAEFPESTYRLLGRSGLLGLPFPEEYGGGAQPYQTYLQVVEEIASAWPSVGVGMSVHGLTVNVVATNASPAVRDEWLPRMLSGNWLGAYCLSEPQAGSDVSGIRTRATLDGDSYVVNGTKQWISNGSCADYYILFARTSEHPKRGLSAFIVPADTVGMSFGAPERKMGLACDVTTQVVFDEARIPAAQLVGDWGSPPSPRASPSPLWPMRWRTPGSAGSSAGRSASCRACSSCWPTWPPRSSAPARRTSTPRDSRTPAGPSADRPRSPS